MNNEDYRAILQDMRRQTSDLGLRAIDERIVSNMRGSEGPFWDLLYYLKHLREEVQLGSDVQYRETLRRIRQHVVTESGAPVEGIRIDFSPEDAARFGVRHIDLAPSRELGSIAEEIAALIEALNNDRDQSQGSESGE
jgi:hypothetical protein